jgi:hypothetical protein
MIAPWRRLRFGDNPESKSGGCSVVAPSEGAHTSIRHNPRPIVPKEEFSMKTKLMIATVTAIAAGSLAMTATAGASGTTNGHAGCVAQVIALEGPPGPSITDIKLYLAPVPGHLISAIAGSPKNDCLIP